MKTFTVYGFEYPQDSKYAQTLARFLSPPSINPNKWALYKDWAISRDMSCDDLVCVLEAFDNGYANMVLKRQAWDNEDLDLIASKLKL